MQNKKIIIGGVAGLLGVIAIAGAYVMVFRSNAPGSDVVANQEVSTSDPIDVVLDFYNPWLEAKKSTSTDPYTLGLPTNKILSEALRNRLISTQGQAETEIDPVLCQTTRPERVTARIASKTEEWVRVLVMAKDKTLTAQSTFMLKKLNDGWYIDSISCAPGEFELPREFTFEKEGFLLKSVPPPYNPENWHLVFEENGEQGHVVPLIFGAESTCKSIEGTEAVCAVDQFKDAMKARVFGQMTENGAEIVRLEILELPSN